MYSTRTLEQISSIYQQAAADKARIDGTMLDSYREGLALGSVVCSTILFIQQGRHKPVTVQLILLIFF